MPNPFTLDAWKELFGVVDSQVNIQLGRWTINSVLITAFVTLGRVGLASMAGYALARLDFPGRRAIFAVILGVMMVPGVVLLIPRFLVLKELSLRNTYPGHDPAADHRLRRDLPDEAELRADPEVGRGGRVDRRREHLPHVAVRRPADGASRA